MILNINGASMFLKNWNIEEMTGYKPKTTLYTDFSIADNCGGEKAVRDTYKRAKDGWKDNVEYFTELVMVLNWKIWEHYESGNKELAKVYNELWEDADDFALDNFKGENLRYFIDTTD